MRMRRGGRVISLLKPPIIPEKRSLLQSHPNKIIHTVVVVVVVVDRIEGFIFSVVRTQVNSPPLTK